MAKCIFFIVTFIAAINILTVFAEVSFINKCKASDSECIRQNAMTNRVLFGKGIPEYNIEPVDPAVFKTIDASIKNLKFILSDVVIEGLSKCDFEKIERNVEKSSIFLNLFCDVTIDGDYEMDGNLLVFPITGNGKVHAELNQVEIKIDGKIETYIADDGKKHWRVPSFTHSFVLHAENKLHFDNLFNGNEALGKAVRDLLDNDTNAVIEEVGSPVIQAVIERLVKYFSAILKIAPVEDLSLDV